MRPSDDDLLLPSIRAIRGAMAAKLSRVEKDMRRRIEEALYNDGGPDARVSALRRSVGAPDTYGQMVGLLGPKP